MPFILEYEGPRVCHAHKTSHQSTYNHFTGAKETWVNTVILALGPLLKRVHPRLNPPFHGTQWIIHIDSTLGSLNDLRVCSQINMSHENTKTKITKNRIQENLGMGLKQQVHYWRKILNNKTHCASYLPIFPK